jgi:hypothetical protein
MMVSYLVALTVETKAALMVEEKDIKLVECWGAFLDF